MDDPNGEPGSIDDFEDAEKDMFVYSKPFSFLATLGGRKTSLRKVTKKYENENSEKNHYKVRKRRPESSTNFVHIFTHGNVDKSVKTQINEGSLRPHTVSAKALGDRIKIAELLRIT